MTREGQNILKQLIDTNTYEVIWRQLFNEKDGRWLAHTKEIRNDRFKEHCEEYCDVLCVDKKMLNYIFQLVVEDAEERKSKLGAYTMLNKTLADTMKIRKEREEMEEVLRQRRGCLNEQHKAILRMLGSYEKAMNSSIVNSWIVSEYSNVDVYSIKAFYESEVKSEYKPAIAYEE